MDEDADGGDRPKRVQLWKITSQIHDFIAINCNTYFQSLMMRSR